ncbi:MAG: hypothetical protein V1729_00385 [Candidatus Woesearchaeota archaeon]
MPDLELVDKIIYGIAIAGCLGYVAKAIVGMTSGNHHKPKARMELSLLEQDIEHEIGRMARFGNLESTPRYKTLSSMSQRLHDMDYKNQDFELEEVIYIYHQCGRFGVGPMKDIALHKEDIELY